MIKKLLYLTYIPLNDVPTSGSSVRPQKMKEALESLDIDVRSFGGINNDLSLRKKTVAEIKELLKTWRPDACYIEPPSGPMFFHGDVSLIKTLHRMAVPISIFYRDAYWKYPEYSEEGKLSISAKIKRIIIKRMQIHQWNVFKNNIDIIYFPSSTMAKEFDCPNKRALPPGGFIPAAKEKNEISKPIQFIFVGGAARNYGTHLTIEAFDRLNKSEIKAKLFYICPENQWKTIGIEQERYHDWLDVIHTSGDENLKQYYEKSDVALLIAPRSFYRDFAVPIKIFEYISYLKPILVTDCTETAKIIDENQAGWITNDSVESVVFKLEYLCSHPEEIISIKEHMEEVRNNNLWISRADRVVRELSDLRPEDIIDVEK